MHKHMDVNAHFSKAYFWGLYILYKPDFCML